MKGAGFFERLRSAFSADYVSKADVVLEANVERDRALLTAQKLEGRVRGLEQGIAAANEQGRVIARKAKLAATLPELPCNMVAQVRLGARISRAANCTRLGVHDEHQFVDKAESAKEEDLTVILLAKF